MDHWHGEKVLKNDSVKLQYGVKRLVVSHVLWVGIVGVKNMVPLLCLLSAVPLQEILQCFLRIPQLSCDTQRKRGRFHLIRFQWFPPPHILLRNLSW
jgi:hypothetical protein